MDLLRSAAKKDLTEKYSVVIYEQIRFCEIKSNLNPHALSWYAEKESRPVCVFGAKERIEQCDLIQKNSADVSAICGKRRGLHRNS